MSSKRAEARLAALKERVPKEDEKIRSMVKAGEYAGNPYGLYSAVQACSSKYIQKLQDWAAAVNLLDFAALALLEMGSGSSAGAAARDIVAAYKGAQVPPDASKKGRLLALLRQFPPEEKSRRDFINDMINWTSACGEYEYGDPEIHHAAGVLYAHERIVPPAEYHLLMGTKDSADVLARLHYAWYKENDPHLPHLFIARAVLPYLCLENLRAANAAYARFTALLAADHPNLGVQDLGSGEGTKLRVFPSLPLLNFLGLLLLTVQRGGSNPLLAADLQMRYKSEIAGLGWDGALEAIGEVYFGVKPPRSGQGENPMFAMISKMMGGGGLGGGAAPRR